MPNVGPMELIVVLAIALIILGPKRLPAAGRSLGKGLREFKDGISHHDDRGPEPGSIARGAGDADRAARRPAAADLDRHAALPPAA